jgi:hypothetical protein
MGWPSHCWRGPKNCQYASATLNSCQMTYRRYEHFRAMPEIFTLKNDLPIAVMLVHGAVVEP